MANKARKIVVPESNVAEWIDYCRESGCEFLTIGPDMLVRQGVGGPWIKLVVISDAEYDKRERETQQWIDGIEAAHFASLAASGVC